MSGDASALYGKRPGDYVPRRWRVAFTHENGCISREVFPNLLRYFRGRTSKGFSLQDYALAAIGNPILLHRAAKRILSLRARHVESAFRASENKKLRVKTPFAPPAMDELISGLSKHMGVLEIRRALGRVELGVADIDLVSALVHLNAATPGVEMFIAGEPFNFGMAKAKKRLMEAKKIILRCQDPQLNHFDIGLEAYQRYSSGKWVSANSENIVMRALYADILEAPGHFKASDLLGGAPLLLQSEQKPVDVVYTWVNHQDAGWKKLYADYKSGPSEAGKERSTTDADALARFHNNDELRYSLRSIAQNTPWVRRVIVFTNCDRPAWLNAEHPDLVWVRHEDVIPAEYLPTFNSHVIESYLHKIPGLSEEFIYVNDDVFVASPVEKDFFFTPGGLSLSFLEPYAMVSGHVTAGDPDYLNASRNSSRIIAQSLGFVPTQLHKHTSFALRRSVLEEIEERFASEMAALRVNRFRRPTDINLTSYFYHHYAIGTGRAVSADVKNSFVKSLDIRWRETLKNASKGFDIICINEGGSERPSADWHDTVQAFLTRQFPSPARWEMSGQ